jgi:hypothetical protein
MTDNPEMPETELIGQAENRLCSHLHAAKGVATKFRSA